jgi:hypothetical protein
MAPAEIRQIIPHIIESRINGQEMYVFIYFYVKNPRTATQISIMPAISVTIVCN